MNTYRRLSVVVLILAVLAGNLPLRTHAAPNATIIVQSAADDGTTQAANCPGAGCRLRDAIAKATSGDTINFAGDYTIFIRSSMLTINKNLTIDGVGHTITLGGDSTFGVRVFYVNSGYTFNLQNIAVKWGYDSSGSGGGGIYMSGTSAVNVTNTIFSGNNTSASGGGGIFNYGGTLNVANSTFSDSFHVPLGGGGIYNTYGGTVNVTNTTFANNSLGYGGWAGGGIFNNSGTLKVTNSTFYNNSINNGGGGGGLYNNLGAVTVTNCAFVNNRTTHDNGGGIKNNTGTITVTNSTFSGNSAVSGGGLYNNTGTITLTNDTFSRNSATSSGGGLVNYSSGLLSVRNSIIAAQTSGADCVGAITSQGYNIESSTSCGFASTGDQQNVTRTALKLYTLANNGGPTQTHGVADGSVAIDQIPPASCLGLTTDQRGQSRPVDHGGGANCDIGAFELQSAETTPTAITLRDLTATTNTSPGVVGPIGVSLLIVLVVSRSLLFKSSRNLPKA